MPLDFLYGLLFLCIVFATSIFLRKRRKAHYLQEDLREAGEVIKRKIFHDGSLVEDIIVACQNDKTISHIFDRLWELDAKNMRVQFCHLILKASTGKYDIECVLLSKEALSAYRSQISLLPEKWRVFYQSTKSVYQMNPYDVLTHSLLYIDDELHGRVKTTLEKQEELVFWSPLYLPEDNAPLAMDVLHLAMVFESSKYMFRFKKKLVLDGRTSKERGVEFTFK